jgi:hypothetical protein
MMNRSGFATIAIGLALAAAPTTSAFAASAKAKPAGGIVTRWLGRYAATRSARAGSNS